MSTLREQITDVELTEPAHEALRIAIRQMIDDCGLKQVWLAAQLDITTKHMSALLANNRDRKVHMTVDWATRIVAVCGHPLRLTITPQEWVHDTITWRQRAERAEQRLAEQETRISSVVANITDEQAGRQAAEAIADRTRHLHQRDDSNPLGPWCGTCSVPWPCQTWEALTEPAQGEVPR